MSESTTTIGGGKSSREGQVIRGMYRLTHRIGKGGMGEIWEATHVSIPRRYAIKVLRGDYGENAEAVTRFHREASIAASLGSRHIVEVYDYGLAEDETHFMAMELLEGESFADHLKRVGALSAERLLALFVQVRDGLHAAHLAGIVHRDLKPDNIFLARGPNGEEVLKILDFGISKIQAKQTLQTQAGAILGTPNYMSPEQAEGAARDVDARADIFSLGAIAYEALSGRMAFDGPSLMAVFMAIAFQDPPALGELAPHVPVGVIQAVNRALSKDPQQRFATVVELVDAIGAGMATATAGMSPAGASATMTPAPGLQGASAAYGAGLPPSTGGYGNPISTLSAAASEATLPGLPERPKKSWAVPAAVGGVALVAAVVAAVMVFGGGQKGSGPKGGDETQPAKGGVEGAPDGGGAMTTPLAPRTPDAGVAAPRDATAPVARPTLGPGRRVSSRRISSRRVAPRTPARRVVEPVRPPPMVARRRATIQRVTARRRTTPPPRRRRSRFDDIIE